MIRGCKTKQICKFSPSCLLADDNVYHNMKFHSVLHSTYDKQEMNKWLSTHNLYFTKNLQTSLQDIQDIHWAQHGHSGIQLPKYMIKDDRISACNEIRRHKEEYLVMQLMIKMLEGKQMFTIM